MCLLPRPWFGLDGDLHVTAEGIQKMEKTFHGKTGQFPPCQCGHLRLVYAEDFGGLGLGQAAPGYDIEDLAGKFRLGEELFGIRLR
jgi:hypothetical protein